MICFGGFLFPVIFGNKHGWVRILARNPERMAKPVGCLNPTHCKKGYDFETNNIQNSGFNISDAPYAGFYPGPGY